jgi:hypothetical protein
MSEKKLYLVSFDDATVLKAFNAAKGNVRKAAKALGVGWSTFERRLRAIRQKESARKAPGKKKAVASAKKSPGRKKAAAPAKKAPGKKKAAAHTKKAPGRKRTVVSAKKATKKKAAKKKR